MRIIIPSRPSQTSPNIAPRLERQNFTASRLSEFTSIKELTTATGHGPDQWPLVILKELADNDAKTEKSAGKRSGGGPDDGR
jgi:hypothetical protein